MKRLTALGIFVLALVLGGMVANATHSPLQGAIVSAAVACTAVASVRGYVLGTDPTGCHSDGSLQFGSQIVTISTVAFVAEEISYEKGSTPLVRNNQYGIPQAEVLKEDIGTGSATLQLPTSTTAAPTIGQAFTILDVGGATISVKVSKVGRTFKDADLVKLPIEFRDKLN